VVKAGVEVAPDAAVVVDRAGWAAPSPPGQAAIASAPVVAIGSLMWRDSPAMRRSARSAALR